MQAIDLHVHSTFSDGTLTPSQLVDLALKSNLEAFALTDHDTTDGIEEALKAACSKDIEVVPGIEFSTEYKGLRVRNRVRDWAYYFRGNQIRL